jgi:toxin CptA
VAARTIRVALRPSAILSAALIASHAAALAGLLASGLPGWAIGVSSVALALSLWQGLQRHALLRSARSVVALHLGDDGALTADLKDGSSRQAGVHPASSMLAFLTVALLREPERRFARPVVLAADSADPDDLRQLRVWMRFRARLSDGR